MPQANNVDLEAFQPSNFNVDLMSDRRGGASRYAPTSDTYVSSEQRFRERTYSLPTRPSFQPSDPQRQPRSKFENRQDDDVDSDPVERMRRNLERTTFLLSNLKVSLSSKPEQIRILPSDSSDSSDSDRSVSSKSNTYGRYGPAVPSPGSMARHYSEPQKHTSSYYQSHAPSTRPQPSKALPSSSHSRKPSDTHSHAHAPARIPAEPAPPPRLVAPGLERSDSNATAFSIDVSTYSGDVGRAQSDNHGSEFHQIINHGRLHNPSRGGMLRRQAVMSSALAPPVPMAATGSERDTSGRGHERHHPRDTKHREHEKEKMRKEKGYSNLSRQPTPYPATSTTRDRGPSQTHSKAQGGRHENSRHIDPPMPKIVSRPFPPEFLPPSYSPQLPQPHPPVSKRGHSRSASVPHPLKEVSAMAHTGKRKIPDMGMRRVRFDF